MDTQLVCPSGQWFRGKPACAPPGRSSTIDQMAAAFGVVELSPPFRPILSNGRSIMPASGRGQPTVTAQYSFHSRDLSLAETAQRRRAPTPNPGVLVKPVNQAGLVGLASLERLNMAEVFVMPEPP